MFFSKVRLESSDRVSLFGWVARFFLVSAKKSAHVRLSTAWHPGLYLSREWHAVAHTVRRRVRRGNVGVNAWLTWRHYFSSLHPRLKARATSRARYKATGEDACATPAWCAAQVCRRQVDGG